nr:hypothetical protein [Microbacterium sp. NC79]
MEEFDDSKPTLVHIKVDVPYVLARRHRSPYLNVGVFGLDRIPDPHANAAPMFAHVDEQQVQRGTVTLAVNDDDCTSNNTASVQNLPGVGAGVIHRLGNLPLGDYGLILFPADRRLRLAVLIGCRAYLERLLETRDKASAIALRKSAHLNGSHFVFSTWVDHR